MILETTHINRTDKQFIADLVDKPYSIFQKIKLKNVHSRWMLIEKVGPNLNSYFDPVSEALRGRIERRPKGIVINISGHSKTYSWAIPYYQLVIYKTDSISIHAQGRFIQFGKNGSYKENKSFFKKLLDLKSQHSTGYYQFSGF